MKKWIMAILLVCTVLCGAAHAAEPRIAFMPTLSFSGSIANCSVDVYALGQPITVVLELRDEDGVVATWRGSGEDYVSINEQASVVSGETYTLQASGTINNVAFDREMVTKTCP